MTLFEIYYHDPWRTRSTYARQYIMTSADDAAQWLLEHLDEWYGDDDQEIDDVIEQGLEQTFNYQFNKQYAEIKTILKGHVDDYYTLTKDGKAIKFTLKDDKSEWLRTQAEAKIIDEDSKTYQVQYKDTIDRVPKSAVK